MKAAQCNFFDGESPLSASAEGANPSIAIDAPFLKMRQNLQRPMDLILLIIKHSAYLLNVINM
jgi:hypothetical protein